MQTAQALIERYELKPHPEGGHFARVYCSQNHVLSPVNSARRPVMTHIYFLLRRGEVSRMHRVLHDELWCVYAGAPLALVRGDGRRFEQFRIGADCPHFQALVPGGQWQAAESTGEFTLCGCTVAPGFDFADFTLMDDRQAASVPSIWQRFT